MRINSPVTLPVRFFLVSALLSAPVFAQQPQPTPQGSTAQRDKIESKIRRIGIRSDVTVKLFNGKTFHGFINRIDDQQFEMSEVDLKTSIVIRYDEVRKVESGYGEKGPLGNRVSKKTRRIGRIIALAATVVLPIIIVASVREH